MKKYFIVSDIHSFYNELITALKNSGFNKNDPEHILVVNGDVFDRGPGSVELFEYLRSIPDDRLILIRGNHEGLLLEILERWNNYKKYGNEYDKPVFYQRDMTNGTVRTIAQFIGLKEDLIYLPAYQNVFMKMFEHKPVVKWLKSRKWKDYFELGPYIITHSFIPVHNSGDDIYYADFTSGQFKYFPKWREKANKKEWYESKWGCPYKQYQTGLFEQEKKNGKILVCGHWQTRDFFTYLNDGEKRPECPIYYGDGLIAIDGCTMVTNHVNVLVINEDFTIEKRQNVEQES